MFKRVLLILKNIEDAVIASSYLKRFEIKEVILAILDVSGIPVNEYIVSLNNVKWLEEALRFFNWLQIETRIIKYSGSKLPAEFLMEIAREESCDIIIVLSRPSDKPIISNLASTLSAITHLPLMVLPVGSIKTL